MAAVAKQAHFVLVHGAGHGAWCWYKVKPRLEAAGHQVTVLDLVASGINPKSITEVTTFAAYSQPLTHLLDSIPDGEKVILVGHSLGGMNLALAMETYPEKILAAVFVTAIMPDTIHHPAYVIEQLVERTPEEVWMDTRFSTYGTPEKPATSILFGPKFLQSRLYQLTPVEDYTLLLTLGRPTSLFIEDLSKANNFTEEGYGSVTRVYIVCGDDNIILEEFQRWMIENGGITEVMEIKDADHMAVFSKPLELCACLQEIAEKYS